MKFTYTRVVYQDQITPLLKSLKCIADIRSLLSLPSYYGQSSAQRLHRPQKTSNNQDQPKTTLTLAQSFEFPPQVKDFERGEVTSFDTAGNDIGVGYNLLRPRVTMTVYVYPKLFRTDDATLKGHFMRCKGDITKSNDSAQLISEGEIKFSPGDKQRTCQHALYTVPKGFASRTEPVRSELYLFTQGKWFIKYRVTYAKTQREKSEPLIKEFMNKLAWPWFRI